MTRSHKSVRLDGPELRIDIELYAPAVERTTTRARESPAAAFRRSVFGSKATAGTGDGEGAGTFFRALTGAGGRVVDRGSETGRVDAARGQGRHRVMGIQRTNLTLGRNNVRMTLGLDPIVERARCRRER